MEKLIFKKSRKGFSNSHLAPSITNLKERINRLPLGRKTIAHFPSVSELDVVRHYTNLSKANFSIDTNFYPLGSCTMKYNPKCAQVLAMINDFTNIHPLSPLGTTQGILSILYDLQEMILDITGMSGISLSPMAGAQGELAGLLMIQAYHQSRNESHRTEIIVPDSAHGTNPATANTCGYSIKVVPMIEAGGLDLDALEKSLSERTAALMLTNPSTFGLFEKNILQITEMVHTHGGLLYYDGANLNAILGRVCPGHMGFDVMHINFHKTFSTPHGGGGPGAAITACQEHLIPYLPIPFVKKQENHYVLTTSEDCPQSIGRLSAFHGNIAVLLRAYIYAKMLGKEGIRRVGIFSSLNANYLAKKLKEIGYYLPFHQSLAAHEFIVSCNKLKKETGISAMDISKRLLDFGIHAPTCYFPITIPEALLIEPTETESKSTCDQFISAMKQIFEEAYNNPDVIKSAPHHQCISRPDEVRAAKTLDVAWKPTV